MPNKVLETKNLNAYYGDFQALFEVSIDLFEGEIIAIIGANGAGKSTFMRSVTGLIDRIDNEINYKGLSIKGLRADEIAKKGLAMVPEGRKLFPSLSVEENLLIGGQIKRLGPWELNTVYELFPDLYDKRNIPSNLLSGGQQQRVSLARALGIDLNNQASRNRNASARQTELNNNSLSRIMNDDLALLNYGTAYRNLPPNLVQGGVTRRFGTNTTLFPFGER